MFSATEGLVESFYWCCPRCKVRLGNAEERLFCANCSAHYETIEGIPDLRLPGDAWINFAEDLAQARALASLKSASLPDFVRYVYAIRPGWDESRIDLRTREVLAAPERLRGELRNWLSEVVPKPGLFLDLGCGAGMLLAAAAEGSRGVGIDVSMTWLVVAKRLVAEYGGKPMLAAALGEALPVSDGAFDAVLSLDVIEHVRNPDQYLTEVDRVTRSGGKLALSTPNRFSLTSEPHVKVWGVGWVPRRWQQGFVRWRSGKSYDDTELMSSFTLSRRIRSNTTFSFQIVIPCVSSEAISTFSPLKARIAKIYNKLSRLRISRPVFLLIGPFFRVLGVKS